MPYTYIVANMRLVAIFLSLGICMQAREIYYPERGIYFPREAPSIQKTEQEDQQELPQEATACVVEEVVVQESFEEEAVALPYVHTILLLGREADVLSDTHSLASGILFGDIDIPGKESDLIADLEPYLGGEIALEEIEKIRRVILNYWQSHKRPFVRIFIPEQDITEGVLQFVVMQAVLGEVRVRGGKWFSDQLYFDGMHLHSGDFIDEQVLVDDLDWLNRNPFRRTDVVYGPGMLPGTTDIELVTQDRIPLRIYAGVENTGMEQTGRTRWLAGMNWGNVFGLDHTFSYQYTTSSDFYKFQAHTVQYTAPLKCHHALDIFGGYSLVHAHLPDPDHHGSHGWSLQASARYHIPLRPGNSKLHELYAGCDFKRTNNTLEFVEEVPLFGKNTNLTQLILGYMGGVEGKKWAFAWDGYLAWSPGSFLPDQTDADYRTLRPFAQVDYLYGVGYFETTRNLPKQWSTILRLSGQLASANLLPSEQYGVGGYTTVRGYEERTLNGDEAFVASWELRAPVLHIVRKQRDRLQFLGFIDYGIVHNHHRLEDEPYSMFIAGAGPGLRYTFPPYLSARLDWGIKLKRLSFEESRTFLHFGILAAF